MAKQPGFLAKFIGGAARKAADSSVPFVATLATQYLTSNDTVFTQDYLMQFKNWVFACVEARAEEVANIELELFKGDEIITDHEVLSLLDHPNPQMTRHDLIMAHQAFLDLDGNSFWYLARDNNGKGAIREIYPLRPDRVKIVQSSANPLQVDGYLFTQPGGNKISFEPQEVMHFKRFNPKGYHPFPHRGMGIVEAAMWSIETDNEARNWNYRFFRNSAKPDGYLSLPGDGAPDPDELLRIRAEWESAHGGSDNASRIAILGGGMKWEAMAASAKDMDFVNQRTFSRDEILALFRVPRTIVGITDDVNRANADASIYVFTLRTIKPLMQKFTDHLTEMLLPEYGDDLVMGFNSPVAEDRKESLDEYQAGINNGWLTINEVREREGLPTVDGGDTLYLPLAMQGVAETAPEPVEAPKAVVRGKKSVIKGPKQKAKKRTKSAAEEAVEKVLARRKVKTTLKPSKKEYTIKGLNDEQKAQYLALWKANLRISGEPFRKALRKYFEKQEKEVLANAKYQMKRKTVERLIAKGATDFLFDEADAIAAGIDLITPFIKDYIERSGGAAAQLLGSTFDPNTDNLNKFVSDRAQYFAQTINDSTREDLLSSIGEGLSAGENLDQIQNRIASVYDIAKGSRTQMIARTEVSAASNQGALGAYTQAGVEKVQWAVVDPKDEDCMMNDGDVEVIGDSFPSGDTAPPVHPNCECTTIPVFD